MKKLRIILPLIFMIFILAMPSAFASYTDSMVFDYDDSLTDSEEETVNKAIEEAVDKYEMNICIVITDDIGSRSPMEYADDFYDDLFGIDTDGILLLINNETKINWISTSGSAIDRYYDSDIQLMLDDITPLLKEGYYKEASLAFTRSLRYGIDPNYNWLSALGISFLISAFITIIVCLLIVSRYKLHKTISATNYVCENKTQMHESRDDFIREYITKVKIETDGGGGGRGGSSTHRSSSGGTHGGGGRSR